MITPKTFPTLLYSSYRPGNEPENINFEAFDQRGFSYMSKSKAFHSFFGLLGFDYYQGNSLAEKIKKEVSLPKFQPHRNIYLSEKVFHKVDSEQRFRMEMWSHKDIIPSGSGSILFKNGGAYIYRILSPEDSQVHKNGVEKGSKYFGVAFFIGNTLAGFEEGTIQNGRINIDATQCYYSHPSQEVGQFISFTLIANAALFHSKLKTKVLQPNEGLNQSGQIVHFVSE